MCVALPMRVVGVVDPAARTVRIAPDASVAGDRAGEEVVSAVLVADDERSLSDLVGAWCLAHAGFVLTRLDADDARSRLACFVEMDTAAGAASPMMNSIDTPISIRFGAPIDRPA